MYCGRCGTEIDYDKTKIIQDGETIEIHYYAQCPKCKYELGEKEIFHRTDWDYLTNEELEEIKNESTKI
jgi:DNA-directed RNA polymerase subunit RPC12/RpoP